MAVERPLAVLDSFAGNSSLTISFDPQWISNAIQINGTYAVKVLRSLRWHWVLPWIMILEALRISRLSKLRPSKARVAGLPTLLGSWLTAIAYSFWAQSLIEYFYKKVGSRGIWAIPSRHRYHVCVSSSSHIDEFNNASIHKISLQVAVHELFPLLELYGGMPAGDMQGNFGLSQAIFRSDLRAHLPMLQEVIRRRMEESFAFDFKGQVTPHGWRKVSIYYATSRMAARLNSLIIVGEKLSADPTFSQALLRYLRNATMTEELLRVIPGPFKSMLGKAVMQWTGCLDEIYSLLEHELRMRPERSCRGSQEYMDCMQWSIERSRKGASTPSLVRHILATLFASTHQLPVLVSFALYRLSKHPEYLDALRTEATRCGNDPHTTGNDDLPLLDSFLKEVARMHPITAFSMPHQVVSDFTFTDGTHVPAGNWVCIPQKAIMQDSALYADPTVFQGFRYVHWNDLGEPASAARLSHPSWKFPYWGTVKQACPARFYVSMVTKMVLVHLITNHEFKLEDEKMSHTLNWGIACVPHPKLALLIRERNT